MTPSLHLHDGDTLLIDNSSLESVTTCPRLAYHTLIRRLRPSGDRVALSFGGIVHKILEARYRAISSLHAQSDEITNVMLAVAEREFKTWSPPEDDFRNFSCAVELIQRYGDAYPFEQFEVARLTDGTPLIEVPFAVPLGTVTLSNGKTIKVVWTGRIDLCYLSTNGGGLYVMDHKTTSVMGPSWEASFTISHQLYGYAWAVEQLSGLQVSAVVINGIGIRKPTRTGKAFEFIRPVKTIQRGLLEEWKKDSLHIVSNLLEMEITGYFPKHTAWCQGKFGECAFFKVCTLDDPEQREFLLNSGDYQKNEWSPLK